MPDHEHLMEHAYGTVWRCSKCDHEDEYDGSDLDGFDTMKERE